MIGDKAFYCARQLTSLARQKHADYDGPRAIGTEKHDAKQERDDLASTATLLHGGISYTDLWMNHFGAVSHFGTELVRFVLARILRSSLTTSLQDHYVMAKGFKKGYASSLPFFCDHSPTLCRHHLKKRPVPEILSSFASYVKKVPGTLQPSPSPGPPTPATASVNAYATLCQAAERASVKLYPSSENPARRAALVRSMQEYVLAPAPHELEEIIDDLRRFKAAEFRRTPTTGAITLPDWTSVNVDLVRSSQVPNAAPGRSAPPTQEQMATMSKMAHAAAVTGETFGPFDVVKFATTIEERGSWEGETKPRANWGAVGASYHQRDDTRGIRYNVYKGACSSTRARGQMLTGFGCAGTMKERTASLAKIGSRSLPTNHSFMGDMYADLSLGYVPRSRSRARVDRSFLAGSTRSSTTTTTSPPSSSPIGPVREGDHANDGAARLRNHLSDGSLRGLDEVQVRSHSFWLFDDRS